MVVSPSSSSEVSSFATTQSDKVSGVYMFIKNLVTQKSLTENSPEFALADFVFFSLTFLLDKRKCY